MATELNGQPVTAVSANSWAKFHELVNGLPPETRGQIVSPELITVADLPISELNTDKLNNPEFRRKVGRRLAEIAKLPERLSQAELVVGTPEWLDNGTIYNSLVAVAASGVRRVARKHRLTNVEQGVFAAADIVTSSDVTVPDNLCGRAAACL